MCKDKRNRGIAYKQRNGTILTTGTAQPTLFMTAGTTSSDKEKPGKAMDT
jgi:hypothetical protein